MRQVSRASTVKNVIFQFSVDTRVYMLSATHAYVSDSIDLLIDLLIDALDDIYGSHLDD